MGKIEGLYGWLRNITCYILFMSILDNLLPGKKYGKYLKLFAGMVLILLVVQPFTGSLRLEDRIAHYYESFVFRYQADDLKQELLGMEEQRLEQMIAQYEEAVEQDLALMAEDSGLAVLECRAVIERNQEAKQFGMVRSVSMKVVLDEGGLDAVKSEGEDGGEGDGDERDGDKRDGDKGDGVVGNDAVRIDAEGYGAQGTEEVGGSPDISMVQVEKIESVGIGNGEKEAEPSRAGDRRRQEEERAAVARLRRKIASYYNLEEVYVEIQIVEGQG